MLSKCTDELISTPNIVIFLTKSTTITGRQTFEIKGIKSNNIARIIILIKAEIFSRVSNFKQKKL